MLGHWDVHVCLTRRCSGMVGGAFVGQPVRTEISQQMPKLNASMPDLYPALFQRLPFGLMVLQLEHPVDAKDFRIIVLNPSAAAMAGPTMEKLLGRTLADFPEVLKTPYPRRCLEALRSRVSADLGEIPYGNERIKQGIYAVQVFPLPKNCLGVVIDNVTYRRRSEAVVQEQRAAALFQMNLRLQNEIADHNRAEEQQKESVQQLRALAARLQSVREEERTRMMREIHDELGQACTAIKMDITMVGR